MKKTIVLIGLVILIFFTNSLMVGQTLKSEYELLGKYREVKETTQFLTKKKGEWVPNMLYSVETTRYNEKGGKTYGHYISYKDDGSVAQDYDRFTSDSISDASRKKDEYDEYGNMTADYSSYGDRFYEYVYEKGKIMETKYLDKERKLESISTCTYENGKPIKNVVKNADGKLQSESTYNENGQVSESINYYSSGDVVWIYQSKYDSHGLQIESKRLKPNRRVDYVITWEWEYDTHGNWISCKHLGIDNPTLETREISYY